jgi:heme exporter protein D
LDWLPLGFFGIVWAAFLLPSLKKRSSLATGVEEFERRMELLAQTETGEGRWIVTPRKGMRFLGPEARARVRARDRRRRVFVFLLESIGFTFLIGLVPPLRAVWLGTAALAGLLALYVVVLLSIKHRDRILRAARGSVAAHRVTTRPVVERYVAEGRSRIPRPTLNGLGAVAEGDMVHVVVRRTTTAGARA